jgi:hypothetical protein
MMMLLMGILPSAQKVSDSWLTAIKQTAAQNDAT